MTAHPLYQRTEEPAARHTTLVMFVVGTGTFLTAMANSTVMLALPFIRRDLRIPLDAASWILISYLLVATVLLMLAGRAGDLLGHRAMYLGGFLGFGFASLLCGMAGGIKTLIAGRVLQGIGGAMIMASGPAILTTSFPASRRGRALGVLSTATYIGLTLGPPLGGWLLSALGWRWIFLINLPISAVTISLGLYFLPRTRPGARRPFDLPGVLLLLLGLPSLLLAIVEGGRWGWTNWSTLSCGIAGLALLAAFVRLESRREDPLLDLRLFRIPTFTGAVLSAFGNYVALFVVSLLLPYYLMDGRGITPEHAGLILSAQPLLMALVATPSGWLSDRVGTRGLAVGGLLILALAIAGLATIGSGSNQWMIVFWLAAIGLGTGIFISPNSSALMGSAPRGQQGVVAGVMSLARNMGMMIGVALATVLFQAAGGQAGGSWSPREFGALHVSFAVAAGVTLLTIFASSLAARNNAGGRA